MTAALYLLVVVPLVGLATAAVRPPRPWQLVALYGPPLLTVLGLLGVPGVRDLGWLLAIGIPYAYLVVLPLLPWRRDWARTAIPVAVLAVVAFLVGLGQGDIALVVYLAVPALAALTAIGLGALRRRDRRRAPGSAPAAD